VHRPINLRHTYIILTPPRTFPQTANICDCTKAKRKVKWKLPESALMCKFFLPGTPFSELPAGEMQKIPPLKVTPVNVILIYCVKKPLVMKGDGYAEKMGKFH
jgi:hypothetical protein